MNLKASLLLCSVIAALAIGCRGASDDDAAGSESALNETEELKFYEATRVRSLAPVARCADFKPEQGFTVTKRDASGNAIEGTIRVLVGNPQADVFLLDDVNHFEKNEEDRLRPDPANPDYYVGKVRGLKHKLEYRILVNDRQLIDPAASQFTPSSFLNSVFWDFDHPGHFTMHTESVDLRSKPIVIAEGEIFELARKFPSRGAVGPSSKDQTYRFVAESGLVDELKRDGYNAIELLPFNASRDEDTWFYRYQVYGLFAPDARYGTPDEFAQMIAAFNDAGIGVIMDSVVGHYPQTGNAGVRSLEGPGVADWRKKDGHRLYGEHPSPFGTLRYDYNNPEIRRFLTDGILHMMCRYGLSGIRFDNLDGIKDYDGPGGAGAGRAFLKQMVGELRGVKPESILIGEMFFGNNEVMHTFDKSDLNGHFGFNFRTHSDYFDWMKDNLLATSTDFIDMNRLKGAIRNPWDWKEATRVSYMTNHDEAANGRNGATGAYVATLIKRANGGGDFFVENKTKSYDALTMLSTSTYLDMPQMRLLQEGSFTSNPAVDWGLRDTPSRAKVYAFFADLSNIVLERPAFAFKNFHPNVENHVDTFAGFRVISLYRRDLDSGKKLYAVVNLGHQPIEGYKFGVDATGDFKVLINSDNRKYNGGGELERRNSDGMVRVAADAPGLHGKQHSITVPFLAPYSTVLLESQ